MYQFDAYVLFFDIIVTNYCIKDVFYEANLLYSLSVCESWIFLNNFENVILKVERRK